jgi:hypothetical protein
MDEATEWLTAGLKNPCFGKAAIFSKIQGDKNDQ